MTVGNRVSSIEWIGVSTDTITTSATTKKARVNNVATDPKIIVGYVTEAIGGAGLAYCRVMK